MTEPDIDIVQVEDIKGDRIKVRTIKYNRLPFLKEYMEVNHFYGFNLKREIIELTEDEVMAWLI